MVLYNGCAFLWLSQGGVSFFSTLSPKIQSDRLWQYLLSLGRRLWGLGGLGGLGGLWCVCVCVCVCVCEVLPGALRRGGLGVVFCSVAR